MSLLLDPARAHINPASPLPKFAFTYNIANTFCVHQLIKNISYLLPQYFIICLLSYYAALSAPSSTQLCLLIFHQHLESMARSRSMLPSISTPQVQHSSTSPTSFTVLIMQQFRTGCSQQPQARPCPLYLYIYFELSLGRQECQERVVEGACSCIPLRLFLLPDSPPSHLCKGKHRRPYHSYVFTPWRNRCCHDK